LEEYIKSQEQNLLGNNQNIENGDKYENNDIDNDAENESINPNRIKVTPIENDVSDFYDKLDLNQ